MKRGEELRKEFTEKTKMQWKDCIKLYTTWLELKILEMEMYNKFTGFKDYYGNKIYKGDTIIDGRYDIHDVEYGCKYIVEYSKERQRWEASGEDLTTAFHKMIRIQIVK
jgi:hypothetical protein